METGPLVNVLACEGKPGQVQLKTDVVYVAVYCPHTALHSPISPIYTGSLHDPDPD